MATTRAPLRPLAAHLLHRPIIPRAATQRQRRTFLNALLSSADTSKPLTINVTRTLPYPRARLYDLIVDVDAYADFLPYCQHSRVTAWSPPQEEDHHEGGGSGSRRWPVEGELTIGFGPVTQSYTSRIVCVPGRSVEALSGRDLEEEAGARQQQQQQQQEGGGGSSSGGRADKNNPFRRLVTRWTVEDAPARTRGSGVGEQPWTKVDLDLSMRLEDPLIQVVMSKVADESATKMIEAFEQRAKALFGSGR